MESVLRKRPSSGLYSRAIIQYTAYHARGFPPLTREAAVRRCGSFVWPRPAHLAKRRVAQFADDMATDIRRHRGAAQAAGPRSVAEGMVTVQPVEGAWHRAVHAHRHALVAQVGVGVARDHRPH